MLHSLMARIDRIKEEIGLIKFFVGACVTAIFASAGWIFANYSAELVDSAEFARLLVALANIFVFFVCLLVLMKNISKKLNELERSKKDD
ncbi:MAG: hypothetical protein K2N20_04305 [Helicobacter sp.]|nr:hypothetical protein [Helicobacter sp.]